MQSQRALPEVQKMNRSRTFNELNVSAQKSAAQSHISVETATKDDR